MCVFASRLDKKTFSNVNTKYSIGFRFRFFNSNLNLIMITFTSSAIKFVCSFLIAYNCIWPIVAKSVDIDGRITNGNNAYDGQFPWHVSVIGQHQSGISQLCSGSLISREWVLTAAHCVKGYASGFSRYGYPLLLFSKLLFIIGCYG